jgi:hypothetical protein
MDLLQVVPTILIQAVRNKLLRAYCHQLVNNLLRADYIRLVGTTCCESVDLINLSVTRQQLVPDLSITGNKHCEPILLTSSEIFSRVGLRRVTKSGLKNTATQPLTLYFHFVEKTKRGMKFSQNFENLM